MADLRYPLAEHGAGKNAKDFILFTARLYQGGEVSTGEDFALKTNRAGAVVDTITLPIQSTIQDGNSCDWKEDSLDFVKASAADFGLEVVLTGQGKKSLSEITAAAKKAADTQNRSLGKAVGTALVEGALNANLRSRFSGEVMNPNLELLFNGPTLRTFSFSFFMSARDEPEATQIKAIINAFKKNMAPKTSQSLFLKTPNIFQIEYRSGFDKGGLHQSLNKIKNCALQTCNVTYTPGGTYSTFDDPAKTMTAYRMDLQFGELDPIYDSDYKGHPIGF